MEYVKKTIIVAGFFLVLAGALSVPFLYESQTLWYKIGLDKTILRGGQFAGMFALVLLFSQVALAVGGPFLTQAFGLKNIMSWHRANGVLILFFAALHVLLILVPEGLANLPIGKKFWPEMVGSLLLWLLVAIVIASRYREKLKLDYRRWRSIHKPLGYSTVLLVLVHVLYVSESFSGGMPRSLLLLTAGLLLLRVAWVKIYLQILKNSKGVSR